MPEETPVPFSYAGTTHAVMMASPADFEDFALGFSLTEGIVSMPDEIDAIEVEDLGAGIDIRICSGMLPTGVSRRGGAGSPGPSAAGCAE